MLLPPPPLFPSAPPALGPLISLGAAPPGPHAGRASAEASPENFSLPLPPRQQHRPKSQLRHSPPGASANLAWTPGRDAPGEGGAGTGRSGPAPRPRIPPPAPPTAKARPRRAGRQAQEWAESRGLPGRNMEGRRGPGGGAGGCQGGRVRPSERILPASARRLALAQALSPPLECGLHPRSPLGAGPRRAMHNCNHWQPPH